MMYAFLSLYIYIYKCLGASPPLRSPARPGSSAPAPDFSKSGARVFKDVVFEDVAFDNDSSVTPD